MSKLDRLDILKYATDCGLEAAANLLLLVGPDGFLGDYEDMEKTLAEAIEVVGREEA